MADLKLLSEQFLRALTLRAVLEERIFTSTKTSEELPELLEGRNDARKCSLSIF